MSGTPGNPLHCQSIITRRGGLPVQCPVCQFDNRKGRGFCAECGAPMAVVCSVCGFSNEVGEKFCGGCGVELDPQASAARSTSPIQSSEWRACGACLAGNRPRRPSGSRPIARADPVSSARCPERLAPTKFSSCLILSGGLSRFSGTPGNPLHWRSITTPRGSSRAVSCMPVR